MSSPKLRFSEFRDPIEVEKFGNLYSFHTTNSLSRECLNYESGTLRNIHYGDIHTKFSSHFELKNESVPFINNGINLKRIKSENYCSKGDLVIADASEDYKDIGKSIEIMDVNDEKVLAGLHTIHGKPKDNRVASGFMSYALQTKSVRHQIMTIAQGAKVLGISATRMSDINIPIPSIAEQQKIVAFLLSVDQRIALLKQKLINLNLYKKGITQKLFSQQIKFKSDSGKDFPKWQKVLLEDIAPQISAGATPSTTKKEYWNGDIRWMNSGELNLKRVYEVSNRITKLGLDNSSTKIIPKESVLIGLAGQGKTRGTVAINYVELCTNQSIAAIQPNLDKFVPEFIYQNLNSRYQELRSLSTGDGGRGGLNLEIIKTIAINLPSLDEQKKISDFLLTIDKKIHYTHDQLELTKTYKQGLLQQMFI
jgi:type I restriction enzyme S subunit